MLYTFYFLCHWLCHAYVILCHSYVIRMSSICDLYLLVYHLYVTHMSPVCHSCVIVCHPYVTRMYSYAIRMHSYAIRIFFFFFYLGFLSRAFTIHGTAGEGGGYLFNSSLPLPPASQALRH